MAIKMNRCFEEKDLRDCMTKRKNTLVHPQQLQIHYVSTDDMESTNGKNEGEDLRFSHKPWIIT